METLLDIVLKALGLLVPMAFIVILFIVVRMIINTPDAPEYDLPPNMVGQSRFDVTARRAARDASAKLSGKVSEAS